MLAARFWGRGDVRIEELPDPPPPPPGWVRIRVDACGICGTDVEEFRDGPIIVPVQPHPLSGACAPLTLGHEAVGTVDLVGSDVDLPPGTRVAVEANMNCGACWWCRRGETQLCSSLASLGLMGDGGLAELMLAPASICAPVPARLPVEWVALAEPLSVAVRAIRRGGVRPGSSVGVIGAGTIGMLLLQVARRAGAEVVMVVDPHAERRSLATALGATAAVEPAGAMDHAVALTGGRGLDVVLESAGNARAAEAAIRLARRGGRAVLLGVFDAPVSFSMLDLLLGEKEVVASLSHTYDDDFVEAVALIERGEVSLEPLISHRIPLDRVVSDGFQALIDDPVAHRKVVVLPHGNGRPAEGSLPPDEKPRPPEDA